MSSKLTIYAFLSNKKEQQPSDQTHIIGAQKDKDTYTILLNSKYLM